ncbi:RHS repeat-associated core domain-containing protein [Planctomycetales bacterium ZRK34]|nr:RHS repeat-associated core domain-containing protein [Planctomycetales bacterium ZRK34]
MTANFRVSVLAMTAFFLAMWLAPCVAHAGSSESGPSANRVNVEKAMRDFQIRYHTVTGNYYTWPKCFGCGGNKAATPHYPADYFYGKTLTDREMVILVMALRDAFWGTNVYLSFLKYDPEGQEDIQHFTSSDMPEILSTTVESNYRGTCQTISQYIKQLKYLEQSCSMEDREEKCSDGFMPTLQEARDLADFMWQYDSTWYEPFEGQFRIEDGFREYGGGTGYMAWQISSRGKLKADMSAFSPSDQAKCLIKVKSETLDIGRRSDEPAESQAPQDAVWQKWVRVPAGSVWTSDWLGNEDPPAWDCPAGAPLDQDSEARVEWWFAGATIIVEPKFDAPVDSGTCDTSGCGDDCTGGSYDYGVGCMYVNMKLGPDLGGGSAGSILLSSHVPDANWAKPAGLIISTDENEPGIDVHRVDGIVTQILTPQTFVNIEASDDHTYEVQFYHATVAQGAIPYVLTQNDQPFRTFKFEHPDDPQPDTNRLRVTVTDGSTKVFEFKYTPEDEVTDPKWELFDPVDPVLGENSVVRSMTSVTTEVPEARVETFEDTDPATSTVVSKVSTRYEPLPWGEEMVMRVVWHDAGGQEADQLITAWTYYDDEVNDGDNYGHLKQVVRPNGYWERYEYDSTGRLIKRIAQCDNAPTTAAEADSYVTVYTYITADLDTPVDSENEVITTTIEKVPDPTNPGQLAEVFRRYHIDWSGTTTVGTDTVVESWEVVCRTPGAAWDAADNLVTKRWLWAAGDHELEVRKVAYPDGRITLTDKDGSTTIVSSGYPDAEGEAVVEGTKTITVVDAMGYLLSSESYVLQSDEEHDILVDSQVVTHPQEADPFGRPEIITYLDGTTSTTTYYECCGVKTRLDRQGVLTGYEYDDHRRVEVEKRGCLVDLGQGLEEHYLQQTGYGYDSNGRRVKTYIDMDLDGEDVDPDIVSRTFYDAAGRIIRQTDPEGKSTYYVYGFEEETGKSYEELRIYPHSTSSGPIQVTWRDGQGNVVRQSQASTTATWDEQAPPTGDEELTELSRTTYAYDWRGRAIVTRTYFNLSGLDWDMLGVLANDNGIGNYYQSEALSFDEALGVTLCEKDTIGDITARVYDDGGRVLSEWRGTNDAGATRTDPSAGGTNNMIKVAAYYYDSARDGTGDPREYVTRSERIAAKDPVSYTYVDNDVAYDGPLVDDGMGHFLYRELVERYKTSTPGPTADVGPIVKQTYDVSGHLVCTETQSNDAQVTLLAKQSNEYDTSGRLSAVRVYEVSSGVTGNYMETTYAYDEIGRRISTGEPAGGFTKMRYDNAGRVERTWRTSVDGGVVEGAEDVVLLESVNQYDDAGNVILTTTYTRNHNADETSVYHGLLSDNMAKAQISYTATWYDDAHRPKYVADYGDNDGAAFTRPQEAPNPPGDVLITTISYDDAGRQSSVADPEGAETQIYYDALGRRVYLVEGHDDCAVNTQTGIVTGIGGGTNADKDRVTKFDYTAASQVRYQTALDPNADGDTSDKQETRYVYSFELADNGSLVASNNLLRGIIYPDSGNDVDETGKVFTEGGGYDRVEMTYYADGSLKSRKDQRGIELTYVYDDAGRRTQQNVTVGAVDGDQRVDYSYTALGQLENITTYSDAGTTITSQVKYAYNGLGQVKTEYQDHDSAVDTTPITGSPRIIFNYDETAANSVFTAGHRLKYITYPNGRNIHNLYNGHDDIDEHVSRISGLAEDDGTGQAGASIVNYSYLGSGRVVMKDYPTPDVRLNYYDTTSATYTGFDRFGRIINQQWDDYSAGAGNEVALWQAQHGYDRASNRLYADRQIYRGESQSYSYDNLHRLTAYKSGRLNTTANPPVVDDWPWNVRKQVWTLDALGNQLEVQQRTNGDIVEHAPNAANEYVQRNANGDKAKTALSDYMNSSGTHDWWSNEGGTDQWDIANGWMTITSVSQDTIDSVPEDESRAVLLFGEDVGPSKWIVRVKFDAQASNGQAGIVFGYKSSADYWLQVYDLDNSQKLYHVVNGNKGSVVASFSATVNPGSEYWLYGGGKRGSVQLPAYDFPGGFPSGRVGLYTNVVNTQFRIFYNFPDSETTNSMGRWKTHFVQWMNHKPGIKTDGDCLASPGGDQESLRSPIVLENLRLNNFDMKFSAVRPVGGTSASLRLVFDLHDQDDFDELQLSLGSDPSAPSGYEVIDGDAAVAVTSERRDQFMPATIDDTVPIWYRIINDGSTVRVYCLASATDPGWNNTTWGVDEEEPDDDNYAYMSPYHDITGGMIGFAGGHLGIQVDDVIIRSDSDGDGNYETTEHIENFTLDADSNAPLANSTGSDPLHDVAGNLVYDGVFAYKYDAWNRLVMVKKAYRTSSDSAGDVALGPIIEGSIVDVMRYDGLGRRIEKQVDLARDTNDNLVEDQYGINIPTSDFAACDHYYYNGQQLVETRDGSDQVTQQFVWGLQYIDELVQIGVNQDPWNANSETDKENLCERFFYSIHDANYSVVAVLNSVGRVIERYEYDPYGQRHVFSHGWIKADFNDDGVVDDDDLAILNAQYGGGPADYVADLNGTGSVDIGDLTQLSQNYGRQLPFNDPLVTYSRYSSFRDATGFALNPIGHQGLFHDEELNLIYNRARELHPRFGRFMQRDPMGYVDGMSMYSYLGGRVVSAMDPYGYRYGVGFPTNGPAQPPFPDAGPPPSYSNTSVSADSWLNIFKGSFTFDKAHAGCYGLPSYTLFWVPTPWGSWDVTFTANGCVEQCCHKDTGRVGMQFTFDTSVNFQARAGVGAGGNKGFEKRRSNVKSPWKKIAKPHLGKKGKPGFAKNNNVGLNEGDMVGYSFTSDLPACESGVRGGVSVEIGGKAGAVFVVNPYAKASFETDDPINFDYGIRAGVNTYVGAEIYISVTGSMGGAIILQ